MHGRSMRESPVSPNGTVHRRGERAKSPFEWKTVCGHIIDEGHGWGWRMDATYNCRRCRPDANERDDLKAVRQMRQIIHRYLKGGDR